jgi:hypothetical protein
LAPRANALARLILIACEPPNPALGLRHDRRRGGGDQDGEDGEKLHDGPVLHRCD